jgi:hypothetical protein
MKKIASEAYLTALALLISTTAVSAFAQGMPPGFEEVSGEYTTPDGTVKITFPDGWSGLAFPSGEIQMAMAAPGGVESMESSNKAMMLIVADKAAVDPSDPSSFAPEDQAPDCDVPPAPTETTVSGKRGFEMTMECTTNGEPVKMKMTVAETADSWIAAMYMSPPAEFDADVGKYDAAIDSLQIQGAVDATIPTTTPPDDGSMDDGEMESTTKSVMVGEESVDVTVQSASTINSFALDEASKTLSFTADGTGDSTVVSVGSVLEGPYTVMVDGTAATNVQESTDASGVTTLTVPHASGAHQITITGTQVVPEFPIAMLGIVGALVAIVSLAGRSRLFKSRI